jgi:hypothetical protein
MSFLSRKPARPSGRDGAGRDDEYDDYDGYAHDSYQSDDDGWSPNEYFSPEGIKGRWAGEQPDGRAGGRGQRDDSRGDARPGYDSYGYNGTGGFNGPEYGSGPGYGADEFATGVYDLPEGADDDRPDRTRRRRRDREDRGERTGILRLRRDRGEDIWPDDGISDEDYWASVAADRPLNGADAPLDGAPGADGGSRPGLAPSRPGTDARPGMGGADSRFGGEQRGERGAAGRLGPPPGIAGGYKPGATGGSSALGSAGGPGNAGALGGASQPGGPTRTGNGGRTGSGPTPARSGTGSQPAGRGSGPQPARRGTGPTPTVGVTSSRPPAGQNGMRPGSAQPGAVTTQFQQPAAPRPSFQPTGQQAGSTSAGGRQQDRGDWDRTERIERVNASGYPEPRPASRSQGPGPAERLRSSGPLSAPTGFGPGPNGAPGHNAAPGRGRGEGGSSNSGRGDYGRTDSGRAGNAAWAAAPDRREPGRDASREASGSWATPARAAAPARTSREDDPLTSQAYSQSALPETDGRSYRAAARRSQAQAKLTEQAETFITGGYQQSGQYQAGRTGEYWQYRDDAPATVTQPPAGRYQAPGGQGPGSQVPGSQGSGATGGRPAQPGRSQAVNGHGQRPGHAGPAAPQYGPQPAQPQRQQPPQRQHGQAQLPGGGLPTGGLPAAAPSAAGPNGPATGAPAGARPTGTGGQNPYDAAVTGSYPYPNQPYSALPTGPVRAADDQYYRPSSANGYAGGAGQGRTDQDRSGYRDGYPASGNRRY